MTSNDKHKKEINTLYIKFYLLFIRSEGSNCLPNFSSDDILQKIIRFRLYNESERMKVLPFRFKRVKPECIAKRIS